MAKKSNNIIEYGVILLACIVTIYLENGYFNVTDAKGHAALVGGLILVVILIVSLSTKKNESVVPFKKVVSLYEVAILAYAILSLISSIISENFLKSFFGSGGWGVGSALLLVYLPIYFYLTRYYEYDKKSLFPLGIALSGLLLIALLQAAGVDVFLLHADVIEKERYSFFSFFGNANQMAMLIGMTLPVGLYYFVTVKEYSKKTLLIIFIILSMFGSVICASDSMLVGMFVLIFLGLSVVSKNGERIKRFLFLLALYGVVLCLISVLPVFDSFKNNINGTFSYLLKPYVYIPIVAIGGFGCVIKEERLNLLVQSGATRRIVIAIRIFMLIALAAVVLYEAQNLDDYSGTKRIGIWRISLEIFSDDFSPLQKIFGIGPEMIYTVNGKINDWFVGNVNSLHSEPVQILLTGGIVGLLAYLCFWAGIVISTVKGKFKENEFIIPVLSFGAMLLFNTTGAMNYAIFIILLSFLVCKKKQ